MSPREYYGEYLEKRFEKYFKNKNVHKINKEVLDIDVVGDNNNLFNVSTKNKNYDDFNVVFLTIGHPKYKDFYGLDGKKNYSNDPYPLSEKLKNVKPNDKVGIIGAGASSIDIFRYLMQEKKMETPIYFFVRSVIFHHPSISNEIKNDIAFTLDDSWIKKNKDQTGFIKLETIVNQIKSDLQKEKIKY